MRRIGLCALRVTMGWLLVMWGVDKIVDVEHGLRVTEAFYGGVFGGSAMIHHVLGGSQALLGALVVLGLWRRLTHPLMFLTLAGTAAGVWRSIVDPWGWFLEGANVLFYPSAIILAAAATLWGTIGEDALALDAARERRARQDADRWSAAGEDAPAPDGSGPEAPSA